MFFYLISYIKLLPIIFWLIVLICSWFVFWRSDVSASGRKYGILAVSVIIFIALYSILLSSLQYYVWLKEPFSSFFLPPHQPISYFLFYSWGHFGFGSALGVVFSVLWYMFLSFVRRLRPESISVAEVRAGFLGALVSGWPGFVIFVPLSLFLAIIFATFRRLSKGDSRTSLTAIFILSATIIFIWGIFGNPILFLHLGAFRV